MNPVKTIASLLYFEDEEGQLLLRPFGAGGPCYLTTERQRMGYVVLLIVFYAVMFSAAYGFMTGQGIGLASGAVILAALLGHYVISWLFTRTLPRSVPRTNPLPGSFEERRKSRNRNFGKTFLTLMVAFSAVLTVVAVLMLMRTEHTGVGILAAAFFGVCTIVFARTLKFIA